MSRKFIPGNSSNTSRMINYVAQYNARHPDAELECSKPCVSEKIDKRYIGSDSVSYRLPNKIRVSQIVQTSLGGSTQYGNFYLGQPLQLNYLGNLQGMPGGSGMPPKNTF